MENFTPLPSLLGGVLIGLSATATLALLGRVAGISGIVGGLVSGERSEFAWRAAFVTGLLAGGLLAASFHPASFAMTLDRSTSALALAGCLSASVRASAAVAPAGTVSAASRAARRDRSPPRPPSWRPAH